MGNQTSTSEDVRDSARKASHTVRCAPAESAIANCSATAASPSNKRDIKFEVTRRKSSNVKKRGDRCVPVGADAGGAGTVAAGAAAAAGGAVDGAGADGAAAAVVACSAAATNTAPRPVANSNTHPFSLTEKSANKQSEWEHTRRRFRFLRCFFVAFLFARFGVRSLRRHRTFWCSRRRRRCGGGLGGDALCDRRQLRHFLSGGNFDVRRFSC